MTQLAQNSRALVLAAVVVLVLVACLWTQLLPAGGWRPAGESVPQCQPLAASSAQEPDPDARSQLDAGEEPQVQLPPTNPAGEEAAPPVPPAAAQHVNGSSLPAFTSCRSI